MVACSLNNRKSANIFVDQPTLCRFRPYAMHGSVAATASCWVTEGFGGSDVSSEPTSCLHAPAGFRSGIKVSFLSFLRVEDYTAAPEQ
jgi:hypothetical protein